MARALLVAKLAHGDVIVRQHHLGRVADGLLQTLLDDLLVSRLLVTRVLGFIVTWVGALKASRTPPKRNSS